MSLYKFYIYHKDLQKPVRLKYDPDGWKASGKIRKRDQKWHGVFFEYSHRLKFVKDGRDIIGYFYERYGIEADLVFIVYKFSKKTRRFKHDFTGRFNLTKLKITTLYAECNVEQTGFLQKFKNRQEVKVDLSSLVTQSGKAISPNLNETVTVELPSKVIRKVHSSYQSAAVSFFGGDLTTSKYLQVDTDTTDIDEIEEKFQLLGIDVNNSIPVNIFRISEDGDYQFDLRIECSMLRRNFDLDDESCDTVYNRIKPLNSVPADNGDIEFYIKINDDAPILFSRQNFSGSVPGGLNIAITEFGSTVYTFSGLIALYKDDIVTIYGDVTDDFNPGNQTVTDSLIFWGSAQPTTYKVPAKLGCVFLGFTELTTDFGSCPSGAEKPISFNVIGDTVIPATTAPMYLKHEVFSRVVESITDESDSFRSEYYGRTDSEPTAYGADGSGSLRAVLDGNLLRGFPLADNPVHVSFKDILECCQAIDGVGVGITTTGLKQRIHVEPLSFFYNSTPVARFNNVLDVSKEVDDEYLHNELEAGYDKWNNEFSNNLDEFATKREFTFPITQIKSRIILKCPYVVSGYTFEFVRRDRYTEGTSKDNDRDNDNFILQLRRNSGALVVDRNEDFAELNNVISPETIYNAKLSVMRNILRNGSLIRAGLHHHEEAYIKLAFGEGNTAFTSRLNTESELVDEKQIQVKKLPRPLWFPEVYAFRVKPTEDQNDAIDANPYGLIEFSTSDRDFKRGYLIESRPDGDSGLTEFRLLRAFV